MTLKRPHVTVTLEDHQADLHDLAKEQKRGWAVHEIVLDEDTTKERDAANVLPATGSIQPAVASADLVTIGKAAYTVKEVRRAGPHFAPIHWKLTPPDAKVTDGNTTTVKVHGRARLSAWCEATSFYNAADPKAADKIAPRWRDKIFKGLDDMTVLVTVFNKEDSDDSDWAENYLSNNPQDREEFLRQFIRFMHKQDVQVFVGVFADTGVPGPSKKLGDRFTRWLRKKVKGQTGPLKPLFEEHARLLLKFFDDKGLDIDGISYDHEIFSSSETKNNTTVNWQGLGEKDRPAVEALYQAVADECAKKGRYVAYANSAFEAPGTGITKWMPYELALYPNIIARPMSYLANRKKLIEYALGGVKLHPGQLQVGWASRSTPVTGVDAQGKPVIKEWKVPDTMATITKEAGDLERKYRVGLIQFALEHDSQPAAYAAIDKALNPDGPPTGTKGQPLQGPLNDQRMAAIAKSKTE
ncbi:MAG: hypothetical protein JNL83_04170 [Myxococcales bacterium]|nr:hypothetical protein [Myxococcales bacterium]